MSNLTLNFFGESIKVDFPKSLSSLRNEISQLFCLDSQDAAEIILTYDKNGDKIIISNDEELKTFLNSKITQINLDISQNSKIYKENFNKIQEQNLKDKKTLEELLKKQKELKNVKETKFIPLKEELKEIESQIYKLFQRKNDIRKKIFEGVREIEKQEKENTQKIKEIQQKLGIQIEKTEKPSNCEKENNLRFAPPKFRIPNPCPPVHPCFFERKYHIRPNKNQIKLKSNPHPSPHVHPCFFERKYHIHPNKNQLKVNFGKTEYINIPKDSKTNKTELNESNNDLDLKMKTIDDWGKSLLLKTEEISNKLTEKYKDLLTLNISSDIYNTNEDKKEEKEIHYCIICDGCGMKPLIGKRFKCKGCNNFDYCEKCYEKNKVSHGHEFKLIEKSIHQNPDPNRNLFNKSLCGMRPENVPKKMNHCATEGNILEKETIQKKIRHFGVKCDQCGKKPIFGCRYKCSVCPNFDYCEECEKKFAKIHNHPFYKITEPSMRPLIFNSKK